MPPTAVVPLSGGLAAPTDREVSIMSRIGTLAACLLALGACGAAAAQDDEGKMAFNKHCRNCHTFKEGDHRIGPSLHGIVGAEAGKAEGYGKYSGALDGLKWDEATLDRFIADPQAVAPGTNMVYPTVGDPAERTKIIEFLKSTGASSAEDAPEEG
jgi:cytochrome c